MKEREEIPTTESKDEIRKHKMTNINIYRQSDMPFKIMCFFSYGSGGDQ